MMDEHENKITIKEAARLLGVSPKALKRWEENGKITPFRDPISSCRYYSRDDIQKMMSDREMTDSEVIDSEMTDSDETNR